MNALWQHSLKKSVSIKKNKLLGVEGQKNRAAKSQKNCTAEHWCVVPQGCLSRYQCQATKQTHRIWTVKRSIARMTIYTTYNTRLATSASITLRGLGVQTEAWNICWVKWKFYITKKIPINKLILVFKQNSIYVFELVILRGNEWAIFEKQFILRCLQTPVENDKIIL